MPILSCLLNVFGTATHFRDANSHFGRVGIPLARREGDNTTLHLMAPITCHKDN